jgi:uncharacterized protein (DUF952 family)
MVLLSLFNEREDFLFKNAMTTIFHITSRSAWLEAKALGTYSSDTLATEGFTHCSTAEQVQRSARKFFKGRTDLVLLHIAQANVHPEVRYEAAISGELFPHIYGPLNLDAVFSVEAFEVV